MNTRVKMPEWDEFAAALGELSRLHGVGLQGAVAYQMEGDDFLFGYAISEDGEVIRC